MCRMFGGSWHRSLHTLSDGLPEAARASKRNGRCDCTSRGSSLLERYPVPRAAGALRVLVAGPERSVIFIGDRPAAAHHLARGVDGDRAAPPPSLTTAVGVATPADHAAADSQQRVVEVDSAFIAGASKSPCRPQCPMWNTDR